MWLKTYQGELVNTDHISDIFLNYEIVVKPQDEEVCQYEIMAQIQGRVIYLDIVEDEVEAQETMSYLAWTLSAKSLAVPDWFQAGADEAPF